MADNKPTFEDALKKLEQITEQIERGEIGLEESITRYEEGMKLVAKCRNILTKAEHRIEKLSLAHDGKLKSDPAPELGQPQNHDSGDEGSS